ncbi:MAG: hypothetical protein ABW195_05805, partial [Ilumatobacteraceae bacterium]
MAASCGGDDDAADSTTAPGATDRRDRRDRRHRSSDGDEQDDLAPVHDRLIHQTPADVELEPDL